MMRLIWVAALCATQGLADTAPEMTHDDCALSYEIAASLATTPLEYGSAPEVGADGWCVVGDLTFDFAPNFLVSVDRVRWRATDYMRLNDLLPPTALQLEVIGVRQRSRIEDPLWDYLMGVQMARTRMDGTFDADWDAQTNTVRLHKAEVDFGFDNRMTLSGTARGIDLTDSKTLQLSTGSAALHDLGATIGTYGLFEQFIAVTVGTMVLGDTDNPSTEVARLKDLASTQIKAVPQRILNADSAAALQRIITDIPHPNGTIDVTLRSDNGIRMTTFMPLVMRPSRPSPSEIWSLMDDLEINVSYAVETWK